MDNDKVVAGVVTFNPDIDRLRDCVESILKQVDIIYVVDNASTNIAQIEDLFNDYSQNIVLLKNGNNKGIATALSQIMDYAEKHNYSWVLTMDQDSIIRPNTIKAYITAIEENSNAGMITCLIKDRNFSDQKYEKQAERYKEVDYCITSAAFANVSAYKQTSGYDESFFIDCVDFDICYSLKEKGYKIYRVNHLGLLHEVGHGENRRFLWKTIVVYHEKPQRIYYLSRNTKRLYKKHKEYRMLMLVKKELALFTRIILYEDEKRNKLKYFFKGLHDA